MPVIALLLACAHPVGPAAPVSPPVPAHGREAISARDGVVFGDLGKAHTAFAAMARSLAGLPGDPTTRDRAVALAQAGAAAADERAAADTLCALGVACGACHVASRAEVPAVATPEAAGDGVRPEMARHDRAVAMAWSGLVRADAAELEAAARALRASNLSLVVGPTPDGATAMDQAVTTAGEALAAAAPDDRGARYGALISTCALCHAVTPDGLDPEPD